jgi:nucleoside phosphorylase
LWLARLGALRRSFLFGGAIADKDRGKVTKASAVLADGDVIQEIKSQQRDLIGVEMEIYGMYAAAHSASSPQPRAFALKSVCDFADPDKKDKAQRYAAYASANVLRLLMERFGSRLLVP